MSTSVRPANSCGVTLVELIVFIVIVGVALAGIFAAFNTMTAASADPQVRKQLVAIAESLMEEIQLMPFTYCDPDDANAATATSATVGAGTTNCSTHAEVAATTLGQASTAESTAPAGPEDRYGTTQRFDNVNDYHAFSMSGIKDLDNQSPISGMNAYSADVRVIQAGLGPGADAIAADGIPAEAALRIVVTVTHPSSGTSVVLEGYRTRYAPNTLP